VAQNRRSGTGWLFWLQIAVIGLLTAKLTVAGFSFSRDWLGRAFLPEAAQAQSAEEKPQPPAQAAKPGPSQPAAQPAQAPQAAAAKPGKEQPAQPASAPQTEAPAQTKAGAEKLSPAQLELLRGIEEQKRSLAAQEVALERRRTELEALQTDVDQKIETLKKLKAEFELQMAAEEKRHNERLKHLVGVYSNMKPQAAAAVMEKLDDEIAVQIFRQMRGRDAGKILANINPTRASRLSEMLSEAPKDE